MPSDGPSSNIDRFLPDVVPGVRSAVAERLPGIYKELRDRAETCLNSLPPGQSVAPTELVHEVYLKLADGRSDWRSDEHFVAAATIAMRHIAIDRIKRRVAAKRGGGRQRLELADYLKSTEAADDRVQLMVDHALNSLEDNHPRCARLVQYRFFLGLSEIEAARVLGISDRTARRDWILAKAWLARAIQDEGINVPGALE